MDVLSLSSGILNLDDLGKPTFIEETKNMKLTKTDPFTGKENTMELDITADDLQRWRDGALIQDVFPNLTPDEREFIKTGITPESWEETFGNDAE